MADKAYTNFVFGGRDREGEGREGKEREGKGRVVNRGIVTTTIWGNSYAHDCELTNKIITMTEAKLQNHSKDQKENQ